MVWDIDLPPKKKRVGGFGGRRIFVRRNFPPGLAERFVKLDEALRSKDLLLEETCSKNRKKNGNSCTKPLVFKKIKDLRR